MTSIEHKLEELETFKKVIHSYGFTIKASPDSEQGPIYYGVHRVGELWCGYEYFSIYFYSLFLKPSLTRRDYEYVTTLSSLEEKLSYITIRIKKEIEIDKLAGVARDFA